LIIIFPSSEKEKGDKKGDRLLFYTRNGKGDRLLFSLGLSK